MSAAEHPTSGATFKVGRSMFRSILVISTRPATLALYECDECSAVVTDPRRHHCCATERCGVSSKPRLRGVGTAKTIPLPGRPE